jgi:hypothetical protein
MDLVLEALHNGERTMIDNHSIAEIEEVKIQGYAILNNNHVCPLFVDSQGFSLNALYFDEEDNKIHLSRYSVGGVLNLQHMDIHSAIKKYNSQSIKYTVIEEYKIF